MGAPTAPGKDAAASLVEGLELEADEVAVLSFIYDVAAGEPQARYVSLLFGPAEMAQSTWLEWRSRHVEHVSNVPGAAVFPAAFSHEHEGVLIGRAQVNRDEATAFIEGLLEGRLPAAGNAPAASVTVELPTAPIRVFPHRETAASRFVAMASRPLHGYLFPVSNGREIASAFTSNWTVSTELVHAPDLWHVGIATGDEGKNGAPGGVLVGRLERRAWLREMRGVDDDYRLYLIRIGLDSHKISPYELVVELQEFVNDELAVARRLPLEWLDLSTWTGHDHVDLVLPMLGRGAQRSVSLYDLGGHLFDISDPVALVESIHITMNLSEAGGAMTSHSFTVGEKADPSLEQRLERLEAIDDDFRTLIEQGMAGRVVVHGSQALPFLTQRLQAARHELRIMDRYFGAKGSDWTLFNHVTVPARLLVTNQVVGPPASLTDVQVKRWQQPKKGDIPPFHDRLYLWEGGGLSVGTSVGTLGASDVRIDSLDPAEAAVWSLRFESYWASPAFVPI